LILQQTDKLIADKKIDALVLDPWNEIELSKPSNISDSDYIGVCLRKLRKFARKNSIHLFIVAHPTKMHKIKISKRGEADKFEYPIPELYDIQGSSHWRNKADNGICVYRNYETEMTDIYIQKIKFRFAGKQGIVHFKYNLDCGVYDELSNVEEHYSSGF